MIDHCVSLFNRREKEEAYRIYVTDTLKLINDNIRNAIGGNAFTARYYELVTPQKEPEKTGDEIALEVIKKAGLSLK